MAAWVANRLTGHTDSKESEDNVDKQNSDKESQGGSFLGGVLGGIFGSSKSTQPKMATHDKQKVVGSQPSSKHSNLHKPYGLGSNHPKGSVEEEWETLYHPDKTCEHQSTKSENFRRKSASVDSHLRGHRDSHDDTREIERQLKEAITDRTMEKSQLANENHDLKEKVVEQNQEILRLRDQIKHLGNVLEERQEQLLKYQQESSKEKGSNEPRSKNDSSSEVEFLKRRVHELEQERDKIQKHSKDQSRRVLELRQEAHSVEMLAEQLASVEGLLNDAETQRDHFQKKLSHVRAELESVTKYKEKLENEIKVMKEESFRVSRNYDLLKEENQHLQTQMAKLAGAASASQELQTKLVKVQSEKAKAQSQLESAQAQILVFKSDFAEERQDRERAHGIVAELEQKLAKEENRHEEERAEYERQLAAANKKVSQLHQLKKELETHQRSLADVEALKKKLQDDCQVKESLLKQHKKELERQAGEIEKLRKKLKKFEESSKLKKRKHSDGAAQEAAHRSLAQTELLYNKSSEEIQGYEAKIEDLEVEISELTGKNTDLECKNSELRRRVEALQELVHFQENQKTGNVNSETVAIQQQLKKQFANAKDTQYGRYTDDRGVAGAGGFAQQPLRGVDPALQHNVPPVNVVSPNSEQQSNLPIRANVPSSSNPVPNVQNVFNEQLGGSASPVTNVDTALGGYRESSGANVSDQARFQQYPQPRSAPAVPHVRSAPLQGGSNISVLPGTNAPRTSDINIHVQHQGAQNQMPGSDSSFLQQQQLQQRLKQQQKEHLLKEMQKSQPKFQDYQSQFAGVLHQDNIPPSQFQPQQNYNAGAENQANFSPSQKAYNQRNSRPANVPLQHNMPANSEMYLTPGSSPNTPQSPTVVAQECTQTTNGSFVGVQSNVHAPMVQQNQPVQAKHQEMNRIEQPQQQSNPPSKPVPIARKKPTEPQPQTNPINPDESAREEQFKNALQYKIDEDIEDVAADVREEVSGGRAHIVTDTRRPFDPNLICPVCDKQFRIGEIQKYRAHVKGCEGTSKPSVAAIILDDDDPGTEV